MKSGLFIFTICLTLCSLFARAQSYLIKSDGDSIPIVKQSFGIDQLGAYYKPAANPKVTYIKDEDLKRVYDDGRSFMYVPNTADGKGLSVWAEIKAINGEYLLAMSKNQSDIFDVYIISKKTGLWADERIKTEGAKREAAKQMVLKYFPECTALVKMINAEKRFPSWDLITADMVVCE